MKSEIHLAPAFVSALLSWFDANARDLPWRRKPSAYAVLVSEFMLQQTTVTAVIPYFKNWMKVYQTVKDLSEAQPAEVLRRWEGLGYYSRARNLHEAAAQIVSRYGGTVPADPEDLKTLPGVGEYTAAAVASIAYGERVPALDANNLRVWSRILCSTDRKRIAKVFSRVLPADRPGDFNQALMDLGTSTCTPTKTPDCTACPLRPWCRAHRDGRIAEFPGKKTRPDTTRIEAAVGIIINDRKILVQKRPEGGLLAGLFEFPGGKLKETSREGERARGRGGEKTKDGEPWNASLSPKRPGAHAPMREHPEEAVVREVKEETGLRVQICEKLGVFTHAYTRFRVKLHVFICERKGGKLTNSSAKWVTLEELEGLAMPSVNRKIVKKLEERLTAEDAEGRRGNLGFGKAQIQQKR